MRKDVHLSEGDKVNYGLTTKDKERQRPLRGKEEKDIQAAFALLTIMYNT
jgi:hypothetical protein